MTDNKRVTTIPSAQPVKSGPRPTFNNPGELADRAPTPPFAFEPSLTPQPEQPGR